MFKLDALLQNFQLRERLASNIMSKRCSICQNLYEICESCEQSSRRLVGCVELKVEGFYDNGGFEGDAPEHKVVESGSWLREESSKKVDEK